MNTATQSEASSGNNRDAAVARAINNAEKDGGRLRPEDILAIAKEITSAWDGWRTCLDEKKEIGQEAKNEIDAAESRFREIIETAHNANASDGLLLKHLRRVQKCWQDWQESVASGIERRKDAKIRLESAALVLQHKIENARQLELCFQ